MDLQTLPELVKRSPFSIDAARKIIREREDLRTLGVRIGNVRAYTPKEWQQIEAALESRKVKAAEPVPA